MDLLGWVWDGFGWPNPNPKPWDFLVANVCNRPIIEIVVNQYQTIGVRYSVVAAKTAQMLPFQIKFNLRQQLAF